MLTDYPPPTARLLNDDSHHALSRWETGVRQNRQPPLFER